MKKFITIVLFSIFAIAAFAQYGHRESRLYLKLRDNSPFSVKLDGRFYDNFNDRFRIGHLQPGWHKLAVFQRNINGGSRMVYRGNIEIPECSKVYAVINRHNNLEIIKIIPIDHGGGNGYNNNNYNNNNNYSYQPEVTLNMQQLRFSLDKASFESDKLSIAKQAVRTNGVYSDQVLEILNFFNFESSRLDFAKYAYRFCADQNNYYTINNGFTFNSSIRDLNSYIESQGQNSYSNTNNNNNNYDNYNNNVNDNNYDNNSNYKNKSTNNNSNTSNVNVNDEDEEDDGGDW
jgi:hypothetical protein